MGWRTVALPVVLSALCISGLQAASQAQLRLREEKRYAEFNRVEADSEDPLREAIRKLLDENKKLREALKHAVTKEEIDLIERQLQTNKQSTEALKKAVASLIHQVPAQGGDVGPNPFRSLASPGPDQAVSVVRVRTDNGRDDEIDQMGLDLRDIGANGKNHEQPTVGGKLKTGMRTCQIDTGEHLLGFKMWVGDGRLKILELITDGRHNDGKNGGHFGPGLETREPNKLVVVKAPPGMEVVGVNGTADNGDGINTLGLDTRQIWPGR